MDDLRKGLTMKSQSKHFLIGLFLIILGALLLLNSIGRISLDEENVMSIIFFSGGAVLIAAHFLYKKELWTLIVGSCGVFIGSAIYIGESQVLPDEIIGAILFVIIALLFFNALRAGRKNWWALIPGGFSLIIAVHILLDTMWIPDEYHGIAFFIGGGIIFGIIYFLRNETYKLDWAKYPAIIVFSIGGLILLTADFSNTFSRFLFPVIIIGAGGLLVYHATKKRKRKLEESETGQTSKKTIKTTKSKNV